MMSLLFPDHGQSIQGGLFELPIIPWKTGEVGLTTHDDDDDNDNNDDFTFEFTQVNRIRLMHAELKGTVTIYAQENFCLCKTSQNHNDLCTRGSEYPTW